MTKSPNDHNFLINNIKIKLLLKKKSSFFSIKFQNYRTSNAYKNKVVLIFDIFRIL